MRGSTRVRFGRREPSTWLPATFISTRTGNNRGHCWPPDGFRLLFVSDGNQYPTSYLSKVPSQTPQPKSDAPASSPAADQRISAGRRCASFTRCIAILVVRGFRGRQHFWPAELLKADIGDAPSTTTCSGRRCRFEVRRESLCNG